MIRPSLCTSLALLSFALVLFIEKATALPNIWEGGLLINRRPELYYDSEVVDKAYRLCWMEIKEDILTGRAKRSHLGQPGYLKWIPIAGGRRYFLPSSEQQKLTLGENCLLMKGIEVAKSQERMETEPFFGIP